MALIHTFWNYYKEQFSTVLVYNYYIINWSKNFYKLKLLTKIKTKLNLHMWSNIFNMIPKNTDIVLVIFKKIVFLGNHSFFSFHTIMHFLLINVYLTRVLCQHFLSSGLHSELGFWSPSILPTFFDLALSLSPHDSKAHMQRTSNQPASVLSFGLPLGIHLGYFEDKY